MRLYLVLATVTCALAFSQATPAGAVPLTDSSLKAPSMVEQAACRMVRSRIVQPNGRVIYRTVRRCTPEVGCRTINRRVVRPNGRVVYERVRRCG
ncbi:MAG TPA: hypothetical protein VHA77_15055 [Xanthobacteraceae bacterium]|jgi:hypothetical protein|nr:hypothetical protein [Xanthobacteraceae bacterium]